MEFLDGIVIKRYPSAAYYCVGAPRGAVLDCEVADTDST